MSHETASEREIPPWALGNPLREWYAMEVWGKRAKDDDSLFEVMSLQVFQAGLTWEMVLARRDAFRKAFRGWRISKVAGMGPKSVERLINDASIIRNRKKIEACITNARAIRHIQEEHRSFCQWFYDVLEGNELGSLQKELKARFRFMGPEIARMWLMASGRIPTEH